jgi:tetratricopeptide (TPR) repeat protein
MTSRHLTSGIALVVSLSMVAACSRDKERAKREYLERGDRYAQEKNIDAAIIEYRNAIQQDVRFGEAYRKLAAAYLNRGQGAEALRAAVSAAELLPDVAQAQIDAGTLLLLAGKFAEAKTFALRALAKNDKDKEVRARVLLGHATAGLKDVDSAIKEFEEAIRLDPQQSGIYTGLAGLMADAGDREAAERIYKQAIAADGGSMPARLALAQFYWAATRIADAEVVLKAAHEVKPADPQVNVMLGLFYQATRRVPEAEPYLQAAAQDNPRLKLLLADYYLARNRYPDAVAVLKPLSSERSVGAQVGMRLAGIAQLQGHGDDAVSLIDEAIKLDPRSAPALAAKSDILRQQNRLDEATTVVEAALAANPNSAEVHFVRGRVLQARGSLQQAEKAFERVLELNPRAAAARLELARMSVRAGSDKAVPLAQDAAAAEPRSLDAQLTLTRAWLVKGEYDKAQERLEQLLRAVPNAAAVHAQLGTLFLAKKTPIAARNAYMRALELDSMQLEAAQGLTRLDFAAGKNVEALSRVEAILGRAPRDERVVLFAATAYAAARDFQKTEQLLTALITDQPHADGAYTQLGRVYLQQQKLDAARKLFETIAARQERPIGPLTVLGTIAMMQDRTADARTAFERVLQLDPKAPVAANNLAWIYLESGGSLEMALHLAETARQALPQSADVHDTLGWAHFKKNDVPRAIETLRRAVELRPDNATSVYHLALAYEKAGTPTEARQMMKRYLTLDAGSPRSAEVRQRLNALGS